MSTRAYALIGALMLLSSVAGGLIVAYAPTIRRVEAQTTSNTITTAPGFRVADRNGVVRASLEPRANGAVSLNINDAQGTVRLAASVTGDGRPGFLLVDQQDIIRLSVTQLSSGAYDVLWFDATGTTRAAITDAFMGFADQSGQLIDYVPRRSGAVVALPR